MTTSDGDNGRSGRGSAKDRVYAVLKQELLSAMIPPGSRIQDAELGERFKVSRTPVREALLALEQEGLVRPVPRLGYFATEISAKEAIDAYQLRFMLEPMIAAMAANRCTKDDAAQLREIADVEFDESSQGVAAAIDNNKAFHNAIADLTGNERLTRTFAELMDSLGRLMLVDLDTTRTTAAWREEHLAIVDALEQRDPARVTEIIVESFAGDEGPLLARARQELIQAMAASSTTR